MTITKISTLSLLLFGGVSSGALAQRPNIILFMVDDMGWQDTSVPFDTVASAWNRVYNTPSMERLAQKGVKFTQAYATPVSTPTRVSLLTGMNVASHRVSNWVGDRNRSTDAKSETLVMPKWNINGLQPIGTDLAQSVEANTLPEILRQNGYVTIHCGKAHFGAMGTPGEDPTKLGFDVNIAGNGAGHPASYLGEENYGNIPGATKQNRNAVIGLQKYWGEDTFLSEALTIEAMSALDSVQSSTPHKPFFLHMSHYAVHTGYKVDKRFYDKYRAAGYDHIQSMYAGLIEGMDKSLGDLMDYLDANKLADNTIIIFMSDNGGLSASARSGDKHRHNWPARSGKGSSLEGGVREPMIIYNPMVERKKAVEDTPVQIADFMPTILDMAGVRRYKTVQEIDGLSILPLLKGEKIKSQPIVWHYPNRWGAVGEGIGTFSSIRKGDFKFVYFYDGQPSLLYDLSRDLSEMDNLDKKPEYQKVRADLARDLTLFLKAKKAQLPTVRETGLQCEYPH